MRLRCETQKMAVHSAAGSNVAALWWGAEKVVLIVERGPVIPAVKKTLNVFNSKSSIKKRILCWNPYRPSAAAYTRKNIVTKQISHKEPPAFSEKGAKEAAQDSGDPGTSSGSQGGNRSSVGSPRWFPRRSSCPKLQNSQEGP